MTWRSDAVECCLEAAAGRGPLRPACLALARDRSAAGILLDVALAELDALFLCATGRGAPEPVVRAYLEARARANPPGALPPGTDPITELPSAATLQRRLRERFGPGRDRLVTVRLEVPGCSPFGHLRHLLLTARRIERILDDVVYAVPPGRLLALLDADDGELPELLNRLRRTPVDPLGGPEGVPGGAPPVPRPDVRVTTTPWTAGR